MDAGRKIEVMGILNLTGDSFHAGSRFLDADGKVDLPRLQARAKAMVEAGADILDLGACSSRPGAEIIGPDEEWQRLEPALTTLTEAIPGLRFSVDTTWSAVVEKVHDRFGPFLVNDISSGEEDPAMLPTVGRLGLPYVAMHKRGTPATMQGLTDYPEADGLSPVTAAVLAYFQDFARKAEQTSIRDWILDPGFGFAKTLEQNYDLLRELDAFRVLERPILVGISRKSMIYKKFGITPEEALPATQVLHLAALQKGASILRVHDVGEAVRTVALYRELC